MANAIDVKAAAQLICAHDDFLIIMHKNPDGDTLGSGFGLCAALRSLGKRANAQCDSPISARYDYMTDPMRQQDFAPQFVIAVDVADAALIGNRFAGVSVDLCIDHHGSNTGYAEYLLCAPEKAACAELVALVTDEMGCVIDRYVAMCYYTGVTTDTGCFRYSNTTSDSLRLAARLMDVGIDTASLNRTLFEVKTRGRLELEQKIITGMEFARDGKIAVMTITQDMLRLAGVDPADIEGITSLPRNIEGVEAGVTLRELKNGNYKVSLRTVTIDASKICALFGGGGHKRAAGFECSGTQFDIKVAVVAELEKEIS